MMPISNTDINDMLAFLTVVEAGSFTLAADRIGIPKANISRKVSRLEERLGVRLLERTTRTQHLTEAGKRYLTHCKRIQEEVDLAEAAVSEVLNSHRGRLRIGTSVSIGQQILQPDLPRFLHQYPELEMQLNLVNRRVDLIEEGFDMLIRVGKLNDSRLIARRLGTAQRKLFASPEYFNHRSTPQTIDELCGETGKEPGACDILVMGSVHGEHSIELANGRKRKQLTLQPRLLADDFAMIKQGVLDGLGVAIFPEYMCIQEVAEGRLIPVLSNWGMEPVDIFALYPQHRVKIPKVKAFLEFVVELFTQRLSV
ncbi:LysR family transcriptional regulator [Endozoicomonas elysicola]|nr:LysR family transcriptional regulator [Endozoicomonas elysicola]